MAGFGKLVMAALAVGLVPYEVRKKEDGSFSYKSLLLNVESGKDEVGEKKVTVSFFNKPDFAKKPVSENEETPVEEAPVEEVPVEEAPVDEAPAEEPAVETEGTVVFSAKSSIEIATGEDAEEAEENPAEENPAPAEEPVNK